MLRLIGLMLPVALPTYPATLQASEGGAAVKRAAGMGQREPGAGQEPLVVSSSAAAVEPALPCCRAALQLHIPAGPWFAGCSRNSVATLLLDAARSQGPVGT